MYEEQETDMKDRKLAVGVYRYEHTEALLDGSVGIEGFDAQIETAPLVSDIFRRMTQGEFDVAEYGLTYFLRTFDDGAPFRALPIFPNRNFRTPPSTSARAAESRSRPTWPARPWASSRSMATTPACGPRASCPTSTA